MHVHVHVHVHGGGGVSLFRAKFYKKFTNWFAGKWSRILSIFLAC